jgi:ubiquinone/menaquinone biosynthesis C-methylase UbiE
MAIQPSALEEKLRAQWIEAAPRWIERMRAKGDVSREGLLDEWMLKTVSDVRRKDVIDLGCGEGRFCRMLRERGGNVTGVDMCQELLDEARRLDPGGTYAIGNMERLDEIAAERFDLGVAYLTLVDVADLAAAVGEAHRILKPGGRFIVCNLAPMVTAGMTWHRDGDGKKLHYRLDNYVDEGPREFVMCATKITNIHRTLSSTVNTFLAAGFVLDGIREPIPSSEQLARYPENDDILRVPLFIIYELKRKS